MQRNFYSADFAEQYPIRILVVEDNPVNTKVLLRMLKKLGYEADSVVNGELGARAAESKQYDAIFMDLQMPVMDGFTSARAILASDKIKHPIYISAFTANVRAEDRKAAAEAGMHDFVAKPAGVDAIANMLVRAYAWLATK
ncbi:response regulator [Pelagicoccus sp. SDUM812003]|uniref:response regulator n=1 Tax=Pelagicoccus sp. SDUM812003 TaxID=3041267 RepID=UPI00280D6BE8|nr:response regulator [Pelagicoccus sp. SDUM812003]MDQ8202849.1 response regulator [Pelagicoccus sp. SDUM812003]